MNSPRIRLTIAVALAFCAFTLDWPTAEARSSATPKGWVTKGPKDNPERVHRTTGLSCSSELLPEMSLRNFGTAATVAVGKPYCEYERSGDIVRVYVLGRSGENKANVNVLANDERQGSLANQGYPIYQVIDVVSKDSETPWAGVAFDLSKGASRTPNISSISFASINGWDVRLDIDYKISNWQDSGPKSQEPELRDAMAYLLAATLKKKK